MKLNGSSSYLELLADADSGHEVLGGVFAGEDVLDGGRVVDVVDHEVESGREDVAVSQEFGVVGQFMQRDVGELGEQFDGVGVSLEQSGNVGTKSSVSIARSKYLATDLSMVLAPQLLFLALRMLMLSRMICLS